MRARLLPWVRRAGLLGLLFFLNLPGSATGQELVTRDPIKVKAAFLRNFAHYVTWPPNAFADDRSPWRICILGDDPFGEVLEKTFKGRTEQERPFEILRAETLDKLPACQIMFVAYKDAASRRAVLSELMDRPVLTVGDATAFLQEGGIIRFRVAEHVKISVNLDQARSVSLKIQNKMLEITYEVLENGTLRSVR
jgi:hypothetical protein